MIHSLIENYIANLDISATHYDAVLMVNNEIYSSENRLKHLINFNGSYGIAYFILEQKKLLSIVLFLDGRYFDEFYHSNNNQILQILQIQEESNWLEHFYKEKNNRLNIITDLNLFTQKYISEREKKLPELKYHHLKRELINHNWKDNFDNIKPAEIIEIPVSNAGNTMQDKIKRIFLTDYNHKSRYMHIIHNPESIAWLLNSRIKNTHPGIPGIFIITTEKLIFFSNNEIISQLQCSNDVILECISKFKSWITNQKCKIVIDTQLASAYFMRFLQNIENIEISHKNDPCIIAKSIKNAIEIENIKEIHKHDGAAIVKFMLWIKKQVYNREKITEIDAAEKLYQTKQLSYKFVCNSFETILGADENSANIHGKPTDKIIDNFYLLDTGGQYLYGTTDITRTVALKKPSLEQKLHYTLVLKGHIAIASAKIKKGTTGSQIDVLARQYLWQYGLDYPHSTGHGVGFLLNVHEGPQAIAMNNHVPIQVGMILSNEPGYYIPQKYGIRIENLILAQESKYEGYIEFETISLAPLCHDLIDIQLMNQNELDWLQSYNKKVLHTLSPLLNQEEVEFLLKSTSV